MRRAGGVPASVLHIDFARGRGDEPAEDAGDVQAGNGDAQVGPSTCSATGAAGNADGVSAGDGTAGASGHGVDAATRAAGAGDTAVESGVSPVGWLRGGITSGGTTAGACHASFGAGISRWSSSSSLCSASSFALFSASRRARICSILLRGLASAALASPAAVSRRSSSAAVRSVSPFAFFSASRRARICSILFRGFGVPDSEFDPSFGGGTSHATSTAQARQECLAKTPTCYAACI